MKRRGGRRRRQIASGGQPGLQLRGRKGTPKREGDMEVGISQSERERTGKERKNVRG